jgi:hypothetical protein
MKPAVKGLSMRLAARSQTIRIEWMARLKLAFWSSPLPTLNTARFGPVMNYSREA